MVREIQAFLSKCSKVTNTTRALFYDPVTRMHLHVPFLFSFAYEWLQKRVAYKTASIVPRRRRHDVFFKALDRTFSVILSEFV